MIGIVFALVGTLFGGLASVYMGYIAKNQDFDNWEDLVLQYKFEFIFALLGLIVFGLYFGGNILPNISLNIVGILLLIGFIGFGGIFFLYKGFEKLNPAIVLIIAQLNIFIMYFINIQVFDGENLSILKIFFAILFFVVVAQFLLPLKKLTEKHQKKTFCLKTLLPDFDNLKINKFALYPILTAFCWAGFTFAFIYLNKTGTFTPIQSVFFTETAVGVFALIALLFMKRGVKSFKLKLKKTNLTQIKPYILLGLFQIIGAVFFAYSYTKSSANVINVIRLFQIILTAIFAWVLFKEEMSKRNIALMVVAFVVLILFLLF